MVAVAILITGGLGRVSPTDDLLPGDSGSGEVEVSVDDDPVLGSADAPVTVIVFTDFECPFCKDFAVETFPQIKSAYIDTGKVKFVIRDLPLSFHDPAATKEALAANCARDQKGDVGYFAYHDEIFARTAGSGEGMKTADYTDAASKIGLDVSAFNSCLSTEKFKDEVQGDLTAVEKLFEGYPAVFSQGIGTPTFFVGKSDSSGTITGTLITGAQPFESFQSVIEDLLSR